MVLVRINYEGEQVLSLKQTKKLSIYCLVLVGGLSFFCNEAMSHHTAKDGDPKERLSTIKDGE
ncbi:MAG: hypothetical protein CMM24_04945 [Rhodospirillaceae bacterium]|nr:hypothetical protein [Rhodospirillaceae bacterium]